MSLNKDPFVDLLDNSLVILKAKTPLLISMNKKVFICILAVFGLGVSVGYYLNSWFSEKLDPQLQTITTAIATGITFFGFASLIVRIVQPIYLRRRERKEEKRLHQEKLILEDLKKWMEKTTLPFIDYCGGIITSTDHKDPELPYLKEDIKILKAYNAYASWTKAKKDSERLRKEGIEALKRVNRTIEKALENIHLKKTLEVGKLQEPYYSFARICDTILEGKPALSTQSDPTKKNMAYLHDGAITLAWGEAKVINSLEKIIEELAKDENIKRDIKKYKEAKRKLTETKPFLEFRQKIKEIIQDFRWDQKFNH